MFTTLHIMKKIILCLAMRSVFSLVLILCSVVGSLSVNAQVGVGTSTPDASAALDVSSTTQGLLPPRMTAAQRNSISNPSAGLMLWCSDCGSNGELQVFNGTTFTNVTGGERERTSASLNAQIGSDIDGEAASDKSGYSVSLSSDGTIVAIGAIFNDGNGSNSGHVRVYQYASSTWSQLGSDIDGELAGDESGVAVSLSSDGFTLAIGARWNDGNGTYTGHVRVYQYASSTWSQLGSDIDGEASSDFSGCSVSLSGDGTTVAIGSTHNDNAYTDGGHVRVYKYASSTWSQLGIDLDGEANWDNAGFSVSLSDDGTIVAIGANANDGGGTNSGAVWVYQYANSTWSKLGSNINGEAAGDKSGYSVSLSSDGTIVAIGAIYNGGNGSNSGHVRVYQYASSTWSQLGSDIDGELAGDLSGYSVSLSSDGTIVAIGTPYNDGNGLNSGHVRVYQYASSTWSQLESDIDGESADDFLGWSVSLSSDGTIVAIGAINNDGNGSYSGHVRVYGASL